MEKTYYDETLGMSIKINVLSNGLTCYIIPKERFAEKEAVLCVNYGSCDTAFEYNGKTVKTPEGIAHFLEHKLFEDEEINVFNKFTENGANVNAFTNILNTAYYFSGIDNFYENLDLLLEFTQRIKLTEKNVEKEKGIIAQEIRMYDDNAFWQMRLNLMQALYKNCPVRNNIAGSVESITSITKDMLENCFNTFYYAENSALICVGDFDENKIYEMAEKKIKKLEKREIKSLYGEEPNGILKSKTEAEMELSRPMFSLGFKETNLCESIENRMVGTKILMDVLAGLSSNFFNTLYEKGHIDGPVSLEYSAESFFGTAVFSGTCENPEKTTELIIEEINKVKKDGICQERFEQIKNKHLGRFYRSFNDIDAIAMGQTSLFNKSLHLFDFLEALKKCSLEETQKKLEKLFKDDNYSLSIMRPVSTVKQ